MREHNYSSFRDEEWDGICNHYLKLLQQKSVDSDNIYQRELVIYCCRCCFMRSVISRSVLPANEAESFALAVEGPLYCVSDRVVQGTAFGGLLCG